MSEILTLAEKFKQKQNEQAQTIERELDSVMTKLNDSMTAKLLENATIIKNATADLSEQNEQLLLTLKKNQESINSQVRSYIDNNQAHTQQAITENVKQTKTMIESHTASVQTMIENKQDEITQVIKSDLSKWATIAGIAVLIMFILGAFLGAWIAKSVIDQQPLIYKHDPRTNQGYLIPLKED